MSWFTSRAPDPVLSLDGSRLTLRLPRKADYAAWSALRRASREFLTPFEPRWPEDDLDQSAFLRRVHRQDFEARQGTSYGFLLLRRGDDDLLGGLSLSNLRRGVMQAASLGYWMGAPHAGQGYMTEAVRLVLPFVFETIGLHRLEAACLPHNAASVRLLEKVGFTREGYARRYLNIDGAWQDHLLFALMKEDWAPSG